MISMRQCVILVCCTLAVLCSVGAIKFQITDDESDFELLMKILSKPRIPERFLPLKYRSHKNAFVDSEPKVLSMSWKNCGSSSDALHLNNLTISPDPIKLPGEVSISAGVSLRTTISSPIKVSLSVEKKVLVWIPIPCIDNVGSCDYDDVCAMIPFKPGQACPDPLPKYGIPCYCPFKGGNYYLPTSSFNIKASVPGVADGDYSVTAKLSTNGKEIGCVDLQLSLTS